MLCDGGHFFEFLEISHDFCSSDCVWRCSLLIVLGLNYFLVGYGLYQFRSWCVNLVRAESVSGTFRVWRWIDDLPPALQKWSFTCAKVEGLFEFDRPLAERLSCHLKNPYRWRNAFFRVFCLYAACGRLSWILKRGLTLAEPCCESWIWGSRLRRVAGNFGIKARACGKLLKIVRSGTARAESHLEIWDQASRARSLPNESKKDSSARGSCRFPRSWKMD